MSQKDKLFYAGYVTFILLIILRLLPILAPESRMWGFNHLVFLPDFYSIFYVCLALLMIVLPLLRFSATAGNEITSGFNGIFFENNRKFLYRAFFVAAVTVLFVLFRAPTHFLGDGYTWLGNLAGKSVMIFKWSEGGAALILSAFQSILGEKSEYTAKLAYQIISYVSGAGAIWFFFAIAGLVSEHKIKRLLIFHCLLCSGSLLLFFGYVEHYPLLWITFPGFVFFGLKYSIKGRGLVAALIFLALGIFIHLQIAAYIPAFIYLLLCRGYGADLYRRYKILFWLVVGAIVVAGSIFFYEKYTTNLYIENIFLPAFEGKPVDPDYALFSFNHLIDMVNQILLLSPIIILLLVFSIKYFGSLFAGKQTIFLTIITLASLGFLFFIDPKLAMPRDWDLFSLSAFGLTTLAISLINDDQLYVFRKLIVSVLLFMITAPLPYLITVLTRETSISYAKYIIELDSKKSYSSAVTLRDYFKNRGDSLEIDLMGLEYTSYYHNKMKIDNAFKAIDNNKYDVAMALMKSITPDKFSADYHNLVGRLNLHMGNYALALKASDNAIQLRAYDAKLYSNRAQIYYSLRQYDKALEVLHKGYQIDSTESNIIAGLALINYRLGNYKDAEVFAIKSINPPVNDTAGYYFLSLILISQGRADEARPYMEQYIKHGQSDPAYYKRSLELQEHLGKTE